MPTTIAPDPTDQREPAWNEEEVFNETNAPDAAWSLWVTFRIFVLALAAWAGVYGFYLLALEIL